MIKISNKTGRVAFECGRVQLAGFETFFGMVSGENIEQLTPKNLPGLVHLKLMKDVYGRHELIFLRKPARAMIVMKQVEALAFLALIWNLGIDVIPGFNLIDLHKKLQNYNLQPV